MAIGRTITGGGGAAAGVATTFDVNYDNYNRANFFEREIRTANTWIQNRNFSSAIAGMSRHRSELYEDNLYILGGGDPTRATSYYNTTLRYNIALETWTKLANSPQAQTQHASDIIGDNIHTFAGFDGGHRNYHYRYNITTNTWTSLTVWVTTSESPMATNNADDTGIFVLGGNVDATVRTNHARYNISTNAWTTRAVAPVAKYGGNYETLENGLTIQLGGSTSTTANTNGNTVYTFDDETNTWTTRTNLNNTDTVGSDTTLRGSFVHVMGGVPFYESTTYRNWHMMYNHVLFTSSNSTVMPNATTYHTINYYNKSIIRIGGRNTAFDIRTYWEGTTIFKFDELETNVSFQFNADMGFYDEFAKTLSNDFPANIEHTVSTPTSLFTSAENITGFVRRNFSPNDSVLVFEKHLPDSTFQADRWYFLTAMPNGRHSYVGVYDPETKGYFVIGGETSELVHRYDYFTDTWTAKASMPTARGRGGGALVQGGQIIVTGGLQSGVQTNATESYNIATDTWTTRTLLPVTLYDMGYLSQQEFLFVAGGISSGNVAVVDHRVFNSVTNAWSTLAAHPEAITELESINYNESLFHLGGRRTSDNVTLATVRFYIRVTNAWSSVAALPAANRFFRTALLENHLWATGGANVQNANYKYNRQSNAWTTRTVLPQNTQRHGIFGIDGDGLYSFRGATTDTSTRKYIEQGDVYEFGTFPAGTEIRFDHPVLEYPRNKISNLNFEKRLFTRFNRELTGYIKSPRVTKIKFRR
jgi:N-acetylneuraminic acid mutarotase